MIPVKIKRKEGEKQYINSSSIININNFSYPIMNILKMQTWV